MLQAESSRDVSKRLQNNYAPDNMANGAPFYLPLGWRWVRFGSLLELIRGVSYSKSDVSEIMAGDYLPILRSHNIGNGINFEDLVYVHRRRIAPEQMLKRGDFLIALSSGSKALVGKAAYVVTDYMGAFGAFCGVIRLELSELAPLVGIYLSSRLYRDAIAARSRGIGINNLKTDSLMSLPFPLPPLSEQRRIVARVEQLMTLCDELEAKRTRREAARDRFSAAAIARMNAPDNEPTVFANHARFAIESLDVLTARPDQVKQLRETILNLAVRGKLVPQDPNNEPASELLRRLAAEKTKASGRNRKLPIIEERDQPFKCPLGWRWARMGDVFSIRTGFAFKSSTYTDNGTLVFRVTNFDRNGCFDLSDSVYFPTEKIDATLSNFLLHRGEIIMVMVGGTIGKTIIIDETVLPALLNQNMWRIRSFDAQMSNRFEYLLVKHSNQSTQGRTQSTHGHFAMSDYELRPIAVPPLAEQHRIVAKVDELTALCDRLEASLAAGVDARRHLLDTLIDEALRTANYENAQPLEVTAV